MATKTKAKVVDLPVKKGDRFWAMGCEATVLRASSTWADVLVKQVRTGEEWKKRQPLPFPADWERLDPDLKLHEFDPQWTIHPGVFWRDLANESGMSQAEIARQMGVSQKHLSQILTCTVMPGVEATVAFANVVGAPVSTLWNMACSHKLALALGKKDVTSDYL
jgi:DNA-binding XRE family transcriptional regulator